MVARKYKILLLVLVSGALISACESNISKRNDQLLIDLLSDRIKENFLIPVNIEDSAGKYSVLLSNDYLFSIFYEHYSTTYYSYRTFLNDIIKNRKPINTEYFSSNSFWKVNRSHFIREEYNIKGLDFILEKYYLKKSEELFEVNEVGKEYIDELILITFENHFLTVQDDYSAGYSIVPLTKLE